MARIVIDDHFIKTLLPESTTTNSEIAVKIVLEGILRNSIPLESVAEFWIGYGFQVGWAQHSLSNKRKLDSHTRFERMKKKYVKIILKMLTNEKYRTKTN